MAKPGITARGHDATARGNSQGNNQGNSQGQQPGATARGHSQGQQPGATARGNNQGPQARATTRAQQPAALAKDSNHYLNSTVAIARGQKPGAKAMENSQVQQPGATARAKSGERDEGCSQRGEVRDATSKQQKKSRSQPNGSSNRDISLAYAMSVTAAA
jgi:hypothetical protein